jgi:heme/copper-type cytochrome/quinol oxidase subunit 2
MIAGRTRRRLLFTSAAVVAGGLMAACAEEPGTTQAQDVHTLYYIILALAAIVFIGVEGALLWAIVRYRRRAGDQAEPPQNEGTPRTIVLFFAVGAVLVAVLFPFGEITLQRVEANPTPVEEVDVQGSQWQWSAFYPNEGIVTSGKSFVRPLVIDLPVGEPVHVHLISNDVMHEFFVPGFLFMRNAMPGVPNDFTFTPTKVGTFHGQCAEFCGLGHPRMTFVIRVVAEPDFLDWVKQERQTILRIKCPPVAGNQLRISAKNISWNTNCLAISEGQPATLTVANLDAGIEHNFAIWNGIDTAHQFFATGKFKGVATKSDSIPPLPPGKYYFQCNVHGPAMSGVFIVGHPKQGGK